MALPEGATAVWVRHFHHDVAADELGWCRIDPIDPVEPEPPIDPARFARHIQRLGRGISAFPAMFDHAVRKDLERPNDVRHWSAVHGGAAVPEPDITYLRGHCQLRTDAAHANEDEPAQ